MIAKNDITGDTLATKPASDAYRDNWDRIFEKGKIDLSAVYAKDFAKAAAPTVQKAEADMLNAGVAKDNNAK